MSGQVLDYGALGTISEDSALPVLRAQRPVRLGGDGSPVTIWVLGPVARAPWAAALERLQAAAAVRAPWLPDWLEAGVGEWAQRPVVWVSSATAVTSSLASPSWDLSPPDRLRALAGIARGAHALHEHGVLHAAICPQSVALCEQGSAPLANGGAVLGPPALADGSQPLLQVGYPPIGFVDPQLLRGNGGKWSDIWAIGATVRYALTGSSPYPGIEELPVVRALAQLLSVPAPAPAEVPPAISDLVTACLAPDPEARPLSADEVADRLEEAANRW